MYNLGTLIFLWKIPANGGEATSNARLNQNQKTYSTRPRLQPALHHLTGKSAVLRKCVQGPYQRLFWHLRVMALTKLSNLNWKFDISIMRQSNPFHWWLCVRKCSEIISHKSLIEIASLRSSTAGDHQLMVYVHVTGELSPKCMHMKYCSFWITLHPSQI